MRSLNKDSNFACMLFCPELGPALSPRDALPAYSPGREKPLEPRQAQAQLTTWSQYLEPGPQAWSLAQPMTSQQPIGCYKFLELSMEHQWTPALFQLSYHLVFLYLLFLLECESLISKTFKNERKK